NSREMLLLYITVICISNILGFPRKIPIDGLFDSDEMIQKAFEISIKTINKNNQSREKHIVNTQNRKINKNTFQLINNGFAAIFGLQDKTTASQSMYDTLHIPHIAARWDSESKINLYPHLHNLIKEYKWKEYAVLYNNADSLIRINRLLQLPNMNIISAMMFHFGSGLNFRQAMKEVKIFGHRNIIIDCSYDILALVLEQALQVGLIRKSLDLKHYQYSGINLMGIPLIDPDSLIVRYTLQSRSLNGRDFSLSNYMRNISFFYSKLILNILITFIIYVYVFQSEFQLDIVNLGNEELYKISEWKTNFSFQWKPEYRIPGVDKSLGEKHFLILISSIRSRMGCLKNHPLIIGNDRYEGFVIDIIQEMSKILGFNYTFEIQTDEAYESFNNVTKKWDRMLEKIIADREADLAITDLTITIDFTNPFINLDKTISSKTHPGLLSYLRPFSKDVWIRVIGAFIVVTALLFVIGKLKAVNLVLQDSTYEPYAIIYNYMKTHADEVLMKSNKAYGRFVYCHTKAAGKWYNRQVTKQMMKEKQGNETYDIYSHIILIVQVEPLNFEDVGRVFSIVINDIALSYTHRIKHIFTEELIEELKFLIKGSNKKIIRRRKKSVGTSKSDSTGFLNTCHF
ncbi:GRIK3 protein, partial [Acromyrmex insinuator]